MKALLIILLLGIIIMSQVAIAAYTPPPIAIPPTNGDNKIPWNTYNIGKSLEETNTHLKMIEIKLDKLIKVINSTK